MAELRPSLVVKLWPSSGRTRTLPSSDQPLQSSGQAPQSSGRTPPSSGRAPQSSGQAPQPRVARILPPVAGLLSPVARLISAVARLLSPVVRLLLPVAPSYQSEVTRAMACRNCWTTSSHKSKSQDDDMSITFGSLSPREEDKARLGYTASLDQLPPGLFFKVLHAGDQLVSLTGQLINNQTSNLAES